MGLIINDGLLSNPANVFLTPVIAVSSMVSIGDTSISFTHNFWGDLNTSLAAISLLYRDTVTGDILGSSLVSPSLFKDIVCTSAPNPSALGVSMKYNYDLLQLKGFGANGYIGVDPRFISPSNNCVIQGLPAFSQDYDVLVRFLSVGNYANLFTATLEQDTALSVVSGVSVQPLTNYYQKS